MNSFPLTLKKPLILASTSAYRRKIMDQLGLSYKAIKPKYEENHSLNLAPAELTKAMARGKAKSLKADYPGHIIIGCDQAGEFQGKLLEKPGSFEKALTQLMMLNGQTHRLITALCLIDADSGSEIITTDIYELTMRTFNKEQLQEYLSCDFPLDCAGSYKIESAGLGLFSEIKGGDYSGIIGLPALSLISGLIKLSA